MARPEPDFHMDELFHQLQAELGTTKEGWRSQELADALGVSRGTVLKRLKKLDAQGRLQVVRKRMRAVDKREMTVSAYRLKPKVDDDASDGDPESSSELP